MPGGAATLGEHEALLERDAELAAIRASFTAAEAGRGAILVLQGPSGVGKSELLSTGRELAGAEGMEVLSGAGGEIERDFPFGLALQLFEPRVSRADEEERGRLLSGAAGLAAPLLLPGPNAGLPEGQGFSLLHGLYWLCANLAEERTLAVFVDDAHWADPPGLRFLLYLAQRVEELPIVLVLATRSVRRGADSELIAQIASQRAATEMPLRSLSQQGVTRLLRASQFPTAADSFCRACFEATGGNPFLLRELASELSREGIEPTPAAVARVNETGPESVAASVLRRLRGFGMDAVELARAVAVLGDGVELHVAAEVAGLGLDEAARMTDELIQAEVLASVDRLSFVHAIVRRAVYAERSPADRGNAHLRAARLLSEQGAQEERVAAHLMQARRSRSPWAVDVLSAAAGRALARGAPDAAVRYLRRALEEPPPSETRARVVLELGRAEATAGQPEAVERLAEAQELITDARQLGRIALETGRTLYAQGRHSQATDAFERGIDEVGGRDEHLAAQLRAAHAVVAGGRPNGGGAAPAKQLQAPAADTPAGRLLLAQGALEGAMRGEPRDQVCRLAEAALGRGRLLEEESSDGPGYYLATSALTIAEDLQTAELALSAAVEEARARGSVLGFASSCYYRGWAILRRGRVDDAAAEAQNALAAQRYGWRLAVPGAHALLAEGFIQRGELEAAAREVDMATEAANGEDVVAQAAYLVSRAHLCLLRAQPDEALADALECGRRLGEIGVTNPAVVPWRSWAARASDKLGDTGEAVRLLREELGLAHAFGAPGAIGRSLRALGLTLGGAEGIARLEEAVAVLERSHMALLRAQALVDLGAARRRAGRRPGAREALRRGLDLAERCGARARAARAEDEAFSAGTRPRRRALTGPGALTPREHQVAGLAAQGMSNREIAEALFVTVKTVEWHLRHVFEKLDVSSRSELRAVLAGTEERSGDRH